MSPVADAKALRGAVKSGSFAPAYYLFGDDDYVKTEELKRVIDAAIDPSTRDFNLENLRGGDVDAMSLGSILATPPMMAERRAVVVRDVAALKKDARAALDAYLERPAPDVLVMLVSPTGVKADKGLVAKAVAIEFEPLSGARIPKWITWYVEHDLGEGTTITEGAAKLLQESVGTDLSQLKTELDKLGDFASGGGGEGRGSTINEAMVSSVVGVRPGETLGDFLDAVARRDASAALAMLPGILEQPKTSAVTMLMALGAQTIAIGWAQAARARGTSPSKLSGDLFNLLKESGSVYTGRSWGDFVSSCARASDQWTAEAVDDALEALLEAESAFKESRLSSDEQLLATVLPRVCGVGLRRRAA
jgi:DNA polymerase-3 subunit delta